MVNLQRNWLGVFLISASLGAVGCDQPEVGRDIGGGASDRAGAGFDCPSECETIGGDANGDGQVDISDMIVVMNAWQYGDDHCELGADVNGDGDLDISDVIYLSNFLWQGGDEPVPPIAPGDVNGDGAVDITDVSILPGYLFGGSPSEVCQMGADVNGDCDVDISDIQTLTDWMFNGIGEPASCGGF